MNSNTCPRFEKCPIFQENVFSVENAAIAYRNLYCQAGEIKYTTCKRFLVANIMGSCPRNILPNTSKTVEEIVEMMKRSV